MQNAHSTIGHTTARCTNVHGTGPLYGQRAPCGCEVCRHLRAGSLQGRTYTGYSVFALDNNIE